MYKHFATISIFLPLISAIINGLFCGRLSKKHASLIASGCMTIAAMLSLIIFSYTGLNQHIIHITLFEWLQIGMFKVNFAIYIDQLTAIMFLVVNIVSTIVHIYSFGYMAGDVNLPKFLSFLSLFTFCMLMLIASDNFLQLFFGWEGVGLCSYLLIGFWHQKEAANKAAIKAFIVNRTSDFAFILGIIAIIFYYGSADFKVIFQAVNSLTNTKINIIGFDFSRLDAICLLLFIGCMGKSAQIGLHIWLPDAMEGPTPVSALIHAATMVTAGVFLLARCSYIFEYSPIVLQFITIIGGVTCLFAASIAIAQSDIKKIIAYSTCSQLGYMFLACGVSAYNSGIFHLVTHAFFKALLFLSAGSIIHATHEQNIFKIGGLRNKMPITYSNFLIGSLALIGIYPLAGFYSKDLILESAYNSSKLGSFMFLFGILAAMLTAIYSMKIIILVFHGKTRLTKEAFQHTHEAPKIMNNPLIILVAGSFFCGMIGYYLLSIDKPNSYFHESIFNLHIYKLLTNHPPLYIKLLPMMVGICGILIGIYIYFYKPIKGREKTNFIFNILQKKYYFDEIYTKLLIKPINCLSQLFYYSDQKIIDRFGPNGFSKIVNYFGFLVSKTQTGYIFNYTLYIALFVITIITYFIWGNIAA